MSSEPGPRRRVIVLLGGTACPCGQARDRVLIGDMRTGYGRCDLCPVCDCPPGRPVPWKQTA